MDFDDLVRELAPPPNRVAKCAGEREHYLTEGAVMVGFAMHLLGTTSTREVWIYPDGEHGKRFDFVRWLGRHGFERSSLEPASFGLAEPTAGSPHAIIPSVVGADGPPGRFGTSGRGARTHRL